MKLDKFLESKWFFGLVVFGIFCVFFLLAYKNPFLDNSLISNLEPFPDSLYYSLPIWNWIHGKEYGLIYEGSKLISSVKPFYGFYLLPFFWIFNDIRAFYVGNIILAMLTILTNIVIWKKLLERNKYKNIVIGFLGILLVTNFYFYTQPTILMPENLIIFTISLFASILSRRARST